MERDLRFNPLTPHEEIILAIQNYIWSNPIIEPNTHKEFFKKDSEAYRIVSDPLYEKGFKAGCVHGIRGALDEINKIITNMKYK